MPTVRDPETHGREAAQALRRLASTTERLDDPGVSREVVGELLVGVRALRRTLIQLARKQEAHRDDARSIDGDTVSGSASAVAAADKLRHAAGLLEMVDVRLGQALEKSDQIKWHIPNTPEVVGGRATSAMKGQLADISSGAPTAQAARQELSW